MVKDSSLWSNGKCYEGSCGQRFEKPFGACKLIKALAENTPQGLRNSARGYMTGNKNDKKEHRGAAVDAVIIRDDKIYLQKRSHGMWKDTWVLPGGKADAGEDLKTAVIRETKEETNMDAKAGVMVGVYDAPDRDPEQNSISVAFLCTARGEAKTNEEATEGKFFNFNELPENIGFDHAKIINDGKKIHDYLKENRMFR